MRCGTSQWRTGDFVRNGVTGASLRGRPARDRADVHRSPFLPTVGAVKVSVRLFAGLRERAGSDELELELPDGARVADALAQVAHLAPGVSLVLAVNREYASADVVLRAGDELAVVPPVSGGAVLDGPLSVDAVAARVADPRAGAVVTFSGTTRDGAI